ncbi:hypothetical protein HQ865_15050 [Mucilaginibacter mali]|uniref:Altered inheritance of mitochondria protein 6 n=1 Tax=Mucilaginibacter mali TaxID=2740462 RepID=A0A7D4TW16_9SPHI|nr:phosphatidylinositol-specific phospholipase C/glycerophosphodiester phosphodiesterase family protein [Mucilaginibacter mali]QKJ31015.1 hypothetical protein HQ865_15050 [Mucilaginibacter mali]
MPGTYTLRNLICSLLIVFAASSINAQNLPLDNAFAHNDYQHRQPLFEALNNGYTNIEADVYIYKNRLVVTHVLPQIHHHRQLKNLYLQPLADQVANNNGEVYPGYKGTITLMIDIKSDGERTYQLLKPMLEQYREMLCGYQNGEYKAGPVRIVLSGHKPVQTIRNDPDRLAFIDEDLRRINRDTTIAAENALAMASCKYSKLLKWRGSGLLSLRERIKLTNFTAQAHLLGAKVRLWGSPDNEKVWQQLLQCGVDLINTDKLTRLRNFLTKEGAPAVQAN